MSEQEKCRNPFFKCLSNSSASIQLYIGVKDKILPICYECWLKIAKSEEYEWESIIPESVIRLPPKMEELKKISRIM